MEEAEVGRIQVNFRQRGNTLGTNDDYEMLELILEFPAEEKDGYFIVLKTEGWSFDDTGDIKKLIDYTAQVLQRKNK